MSITDLPISKGFVIFYMTRIKKLAYRMEIRLVDAENKISPNEKKTRPVDVEDKKLTDKEELKPTDAE